MTAPLRSLPRCFVPGAGLDEPITLPEEDYQKFHRVLRLAPGDEILVLPNDGSGIRARYQGKTALPEERVFPNTESASRITIVQALPKGDKLDEIVRSCSEIGAAGFVFFPADRTIVKWDEAKVMARMKRLETISKEACEI